MVVVFGCASKKPQAFNEPESPAGSGGPAPSVAPQPPPAGSGASNAAAVASSSTAAQVPPPVPVASTGKMEVLGTMSDSSPGAATVARPPCNLDNCAVVLGISVSQMAESVAHDDGGPGVYLPEGMTSMATAGEPGVWDAYGVEKLVPVWNVTVLPRNGTPQVIQQRTAPAFGIGDPVLLDGNTLLPWN
jgi:hypothetical protein